MRAVSNWQCLASSVNILNLSFQVNNGGYTIEVEIHDGPAHNNYNIIKNW